MTTKKTKLDQSHASTKKTDSFWEGKTGEELAREQGVAPVKDEMDFAYRFWGGGEDWDDMDEFLKYFHSH